MKVNLLVASLTFILGFTHLVKGQIVSFTSSVDQACNLVQHDPIAPRDIQIKALTLGNKFICYADSALMVNDSTLTFQFKFDDSIKNIRLIFHTLSYKDYYKNIPLSKENSEYRLGKLNFKEKKHEISLLDIVTSDDFKFTFKLNNISNSEVLITDIKFLFYPGEGVQSVNKPEYISLYEFPFIAIFEDQEIIVSKGDRLAKNDYLKSKEESMNNKPEWMMWAPPHKWLHPYLVTLPLKISEKIPPKKTNEFVIKMILNPEFLAKQYSSNSTINWHAGTGWREMYEAQAIITYNGEKRLLTPIFRITYQPTDYVLPSNKN